tara:strand:- start:49 stop:339 length:291 start_codon:yes stop_codon:yes gene_type:complete
MKKENPQQEPQNINFDGDDYNVQDLTPRVANEFNTLFRIQNELNDLSYQIKKCQAAQTVITEGLKEAIKEDKVKPLEKEQVVLEDSIEAKDEASVN